jgi:hypothetical protein
VRDWRREIEKIGHPNLRASLVGALWDFAVGAGFSPSLILFPPSAYPDFPSSVPDFTKERRV